jgi:hypothetical protein
LVTLININCEARENWRRRKEVSRHYFLVKLFPNHINQKRQLELLILTPKASTDPPNLRCISKFTKKSRLLSAVYKFKHLLSGTLALCSSDLWLTQGRDNEQACNGDSALFSTATAAPYFQTDKPLALKAHLQLVKKTEIVIETRPITF